MTTTELTPNKENIAKAIKALRTTEKKQGYGEIYDPKTNCFCSIGVIASELLGIKLDDLDSISSDRAKEPYTAVGDFLGIDINQMWEKNDTVFDKSGDSNHGFEATAHWLSTL